MPGKSVRPFFEGRSILEWILVRVKGTTELPLVVATTTSQSDDGIEVMASRYQALFYRGSETDVLHRFIQAAELNAIDSIVRICSDNPFLDVDGIHALVSEAARPAFDYCSFRVDTDTPAIRSHLGLYAELVSVDALKRVQNLTTDAYDHEHVTKFIYEHPSHFNLRWLQADPSVFGRQDLRFTVDDPIDFALMQQLYGELRPDTRTVSLPQLIAHVDAHPEYGSVMKSQIAKYTK
jgi:spore coat polysaccharide biosynthesis protein SpsF